MAGPPKLPPPKGPPPKPAGAPKMPPPPKTGAAAPVRAAKTFEIIEFSGEGEGEKIVAYGTSGMGKTTLAAMAPRPKFIGVDDGARKIRDPRTGAVLKAVGGVRDFDDIRDALHQNSLFDPGDTLVLDTVTKAEELSEPYIFEHYLAGEGKRAKSLESYGYGKGYRHALEVLRLLLQDCEGQARRGVNVLLLAQESAAKMPNAEGLDYLQAGPKLHHTAQYSSRLEVQEWADHVLRIGYQETKVAGAANATKGKIVSDDTTRVIYAREARHFFAKSRTLREPVISYALDENGNPTDDSLWRFMFPQEYK